MYKENEYLFLEVDLVEINVPIDIINNSSFKKFKYQKV